jgi:1-acyl-sn-glycerol-3-phosphate acyltransferase
MIQSVVTFALLVSIQTLSRLFFRLQEEWLGPIPRRDWGHMRVIIILNHTSLYEPILAGYADWRLLWLFARHGVLPVAEKTMRRRIGIFFRLLVRHAVVVTRQRDETWDRVLNSVDDRSVVIILPEGRMKRRNGLDSGGRPMTVRGGIADILEPLDSGRLLFLYSGGFHHVQVPGERRLPRLFKTIRTRFEILEIDDYKASVMAAAEGGDLRAALIADLTQRRDHHCPPLLDPSLREEAASR